MVIDIEKKFTVGCDQGYKNIKKIYRIFVNFLLRKFNKRIVFYIIQKYFKNIAPYKKKKIKKYSFDRSV